MSRKIALLTNGPGELWGWVRPFAAELLRRRWDVSLRILPCQFASGEERRIALALGIPDVSGPESPLRTALSMRKFGKGANETPPEAVVQLGGDLLWGRMLSASARAPLFCYSYGRKNGIERCAVLFTAYREMAESIASSGEGQALQRTGRILLAGDLAAELSDTFVHAPDGEDRIPEGRPRVAFFPGSREHIREYAVPLIRELAAALRESFPALDARIILSPFASAGEEEAFRRSGDLIPVRGGSKESLRGLDFAVTQPGTNTLELMHCAVPFLVAVPFSSLRHIPLPGVAGALANIPLIGPALREAALKAKGRRTGFVAWPNRLAGRQVVDELIGDISARDVARVVGGHLLDGEYLARTRKSLAALSSSAPRNAAVFMADHIERMLAER